MEIRTAMVPLSEVYDASSDVCLMDTTSTLVANLSKSEALRYAKAMMKIGKGITLNRKDLTLFDRIDALTYEVHGMCLKDSKVTQARLKACKKHKVEFIDRDHLIEHMDQMLPNSDGDLNGDNFYQGLEEFFIDRLRVESMYALQDLYLRLDSGSELTLKDLNLLSRFEELTFEELGLSIITRELRDAIDRASKRLGIYFKNLQKREIH